jgi:hypothetical protein
MARVKVCSNCGRKSGPTKFRCPCGASIAHIAPVEEQETPEPPPAADVPREPLRGTVREVVATATCAALDFPWGSVAVSSRLPVGRDPEYSPIAERLATYDAVSARHAEVFVKHGFLYVRDVGTAGIGSTNKTYVNGAPIEAGVGVELADGDQLGFSRSLTVTVRLG